MATTKNTSSPLWFRFWHFLNALFFLTLLITGLNIRNVGSDLELFSYEVSVLIHNVVGSCIIVAYLFYLIRTHVKKEGPGHWHTAGKSNTKVVAGQPKKRHPMHRFTYLMVLYVLVPLLCITGIVLMLPDSMMQQFMGNRGGAVAILMHSIGGYVASIFLATHLYFAFIGFFNQKQ
ncbi:cytochrome b/b6 domain-containing protein [Marinilabiliaceae bacterium JC017]|nr:cytochrome b/b6 domain-containing protein [Marinilabiliaceae bacterium JC017]